MISSKLQCIIRTEVVWHFSAGGSRIGIIVHPSQNHITRTLTVHNTDSVPVPYIVLSTLYKYKFN